MNHCISIGISEYEGECFGPFEIESEQDGFICCECLQTVIKGWGFIFTDEEGESRSYLICPECLSISEDLFCDYPAMGTLWKEVFNFADTQDSEEDFEEVISMIPKSWLKENEPGYIKEWVDGK